jgi:hypothetical protein
MKSKKQLLLTNLSALADKLKYKITYYDITYNAIALSRPAKMALTGDIYVVNYPC